VKDIYVVAMTHAMTNGHQMSIGSIHHEQQKNREGRTCLANARSRELGVLDSSDNGISKQTGQNVPAHALRYATSPYKLVRQSLTEQLQLRGIYALLVNLERTGQSQRCVGAIQTYLLAFGSAGLFSACAFRLHVMPLGNNAHATFQHGHGLHG
jgi:hypothetical protein